TEVMPPQIGVFYPTTSMYCVMPVDSVKIVSEKLHESLFDRGYHYCHVFEKAILENMDALNNYRIIILPYAVHLPPEMNEKILGYIKSGGVVIALGPCGIYNEIGMDDGKIMNTLFPGVTATYLGNNTQQWSFGGTADRFRSSGETSVGKLSFLKVPSKVITTEYGKGRIFVTSDGLDFGREFYDVLDGFSAPVAWWNPDVPLRCILRQGNAGNYLLAINQSSKENAPIDEKIFIHGNYTAEDVSLPGISLPVQHVDGMTVLPVYLQPGRAALYKLDGLPFAYPNADAANRALQAKLSHVVASLPPGDAAALQKTESALADVAVLMAANDQYAIAKKVNKYSLDFKWATLQSQIAKTAAVSADATPAEQARKKYWQRYMNLVTDEMSQTGNADKRKEATDENIAYQASKPTLPAKKHVLAQKCSSALTIDGDLGEWSGYQFQPIGENVRFATCHDDDALYFAIQVEDAVFFNNNNGLKVCQGDDVEIFLDVLNCKRGVYHFDDYQYLIGVNGNSYLLNPRRKEIPAEVKSATKKMAAGGYTMEVRIDLKSLQIPLVEGYLFGFEMQIAYSNGLGGIVSGKTVTWTGISSPNKITSSWGTLELR
ncbi:MAG: sugar-binding protein, partial [Victivallales bacterium]